MKKQLAQRTVAFKLGIALLVVATTIVACGGSFSGDVSFDTPRVTLDSGGTSLKLKLNGPDANKTTVHFQFKDAEGEPLANASIQGSGSIDMPRGTETVDYSTDAPFTDEQGDNDQAAPTSPSSGWRNSESLGARDYLVGCNSVVYNPDNDQIAASVRVRSRSADAARDTGFAVIMSGPESAAPSNVTVDMLAHVTTGTASVVLTSSHPDGFSSFQVLLDGAVVADASTGLNTTTSVSPGGWAVLTAALPISLLSNGGELTIVQEGLGADGPSSATITLQ